MKNAILIILLLIVFPLTPFVVMGCVARSDYVDELSKKQAQTADIVSKVAELHADLADETHSLQSKEARKIATYAEANAGDSMDFSKQGSGVNIDPYLNKAMTGDWVGLGGLVVSTLLGGFAYQQKRKATQHLKLAEEVAEMEPTKAREHLKAKKV